MRHPNEVKPQQHSVLEIYIFWTDRTMERHCRIHNIYSQPQISIVERHITSESYQCRRQRSAWNQSMRHLSRWPNCSARITKMATVTECDRSLFRAWFHPFGDFWFAEATDRLKSTSILALIGYDMLIFSKNGSYAWFSPEIMQI